VRAYAGSLGSYNLRVMISSSSRVSMSVMLRGLVIVALLAGLTWWLLPGGGAERIAESLPGRAQRSVEVNGEAPDFRLAAPDGGSLSLSDLRGRVVVLNFWATWCTPCRAEMPALEQVYRAHQDEGLVIVGIDVQEAADRVSAFLPEVGVTFPILLDSDTRIATRYRATGLPASFIVDRHGIVRDIRLGPYSEEMLLPRLEPLLRG
jgi:cytochrome c biogenesis protein CcmG/thiol:disulfide interchange protein DsbE